MKRFFSLLALFLLVPSVLYAQGTGNPSNIRVRIDSTGALTINASATPTPPYTFPIFSTARLKVDSSGNLVVSCADCGGGGEVTLAGNNTFTGTNIFSGHSLQAYISDDEGVTIGQTAGTSDTSDSINIGFAAGQTATGTTSTRIGRHAGSAAAGSNAVMLGHAAGQQVKDSDNAVIIGYLAGRNSTNNASWHSSGSVIIGHQALEAGLNAQGLVAIGDNAGRNCTNAVSSVFLGAYAAESATNCRDSIYIGSTAGRNLSRNNTLVIEGDSSIAPVGTTAMLYGEFDNRLLVINSALQMGVMPARPACAVGNRGKIWFVPGGSGVADTYAICAKDVTNSYAWRDAAVIITAPSAPVACTSPTVTNSNGTAAFRIDVGSSCTGVKTLAFTMPAATNGWNCHADNITTPSNIRVSATGTTSVTLTNYSITTGVSTDFTNGDDIDIMCVAR